MAIHGEGIRGADANGPCVPASPSKGSSFPDSEQRQYDRYALQLDATIGIPGGPSRACQIRDFCPGGLFLAVEATNGTGIVIGEKTLERDDELVVRFSVEAGGTATEFEVTVLVARVIAGGMGVAFDGRNGPAIHALNNLLFHRHQARQLEATASAAEDSLVDDVATEDVVEASDASNVLDAYRRRVVTFLESNLAALFEHARDRLFAAARDTRAGDAQSKLFNAIQELDGLKEAVEKAFLKTTVTQLEQPAARPPGADGLVSDPARVDVALVDTGTFDDWVIIKDIIARSTPKYADRQQEIAASLSKLMNISIDDDNNPVGLTGVGLTFHDAIQNLGAGRDCRQAIIEGFEETVIAGLGTLYDDLIEILSNREVSSDVERTIVKRSLAVALGDEKIVEPVTEAPIEPAAAEESQPATVLGIDPASITPPSVVVGDLLHTARGLLMLERQAKLSDNLPAALADMAGAQPLPPPDIGSKSLDQVIDALSILQRSPKFTAAGDEGPLALKERLMTTWRAAGLQVTDGEGDAVEVISNLLDAIIADPLVTPRVKSCVRRLSIALVKVALQDREFFSKENHPVRQLINQLGRVEIAADGSVIANGAWQTTIDPLVDRIVHDYERDPIVFNQVLVDLERIIARQEEHLSEKVSQIVQDRNQQQAVLGSRRGDEQSGEDAEAESISSVVNDGDMPTEWKRWLNRVQHLQAGDIIFLDRNVDRPEKMYLVWVSDKRDSYLFASDCGEKTSTLTQQELAMHFRRGAARVLDDSDLPVVDRGMYQLLNALHARLAKKASHDGVTGMLNRKAFEAAIGKTMADAVRMGTNHVLCVLEIDKFRAVVEKCGQKAGKGLLRKLAHVLEKHVGSKGAIGRLTKGRFAVLLNNCDLDEGRSIVDRQRKSMENSSCVWQGESFQLTVSVGMVTLDAENRATVADLVEAATGAFKRAHRAGGNRIEIGDKAKPEPVSADPTVLQMLAENRLQLRCQRLAPIGADSKAMSYFEILLGVMDETGKIMMPGDFIQAAERNDEMHEVDRWVIRNAIDWMSKHRSKVDSVGGYSINLSGLTLGDDSLLRYVLDRLTESQVPPSKVIFEVTESAAIDTLSVAVNFIKTLKEYGCRFALDDFGTGDASFAYLKTLPIDFVKIDGSIVKDIVDSPKDLALVKSINEIGHFLGKKTVAEFVENDDVLARLRQVGVDYAQGFGIEAPFILS